ncbi:F18 fimbrial protein FedE [Escherichia coli]|uniref:F18 fimbrial protein FedE n=1 Tax=Escherichia coli TaxID=562 RepID=UPI002543985C|nr:F18 fimbrial protein FedE [Escherichia coli]
MTFTKAVLAVLMMVVTVGDVQAATTATLTINVTFTQPTCNIAVPTSYNLGSLTPGSKEHGDLKITWTCDGNMPIKTALTAGIVAGSADGNDKVRLMVDGQTTDVVLSLREKGSDLIKLTGHNAKDYFCSDAKNVTGMRTCTLTPVTTVVYQNGRGGRVSATLDFAVAYR